MLHIVLRDHQDPVVARLLHFGYLARCQGRCNQRVHRCDVLPIDLDAQALLVRWPDAAVQDVERQDLCANSSQRGNPPP
jgi:hypothetical protein